MVGLRLGFLPVTSQLAARPMESGFDGADREVERLGNLGL